MQRCGPARASATRLRALDAFSVFAARLTGALAIFPPDGQLTALAANEAQILRQHQEAERNHPEAEDWQEAEKAANHKHRADNDASDTRARHRHAPFAHVKTPRFGVNTEIHARSPQLDRVGEIFFNIVMPGNVGPSVDKTRGIHFF